MTTFSLQDKICFNFLLVALNVFDTFHIVFAILDVIRNNHEEFYPDALLSIFPFFHYPLYRLETNIANSLPSDVHVHVHVELHK